MSELGRIEPKRFGIQAGQVYEYYPFGDDGIMTTTIKSVDGMTKFIEHTHGLIHATEFVKMDPVLIGNRAKFLKIFPYTKKIK